MRGFVFIMNFLGMRGVSGVSLRRFAFFCVMLGMLGNGVAGDQAPASREGLQKKCEKGDASSCLALGDLYAMGRGVAQDRERAAALLEQACKGGAAMGCSNLGRLYENGWGVSQDLPHAVALYELACKDGAAEGCYNLGMLYESGKGVAEDLQRAAVLFEQGCKGRDHLSCSSLASLYQSGRGVAKDAWRATHLFRQSCYYGMSVNCPSPGRGDKLFVQSTALNLRAEPKASAVVLKQVPIGSECSAIKRAPDGWIELRCGMHRGFGKLEFLEPTPPSLEEMLRWSREPTVSRSEAMNMLQRTVMLSRDSAVKQEFRERFWDSEFERLAHAQAANDTMKPPQVVRWPAQCANPETCVKAAFASISPRGVWQELHISGSSVLYARLFEDGLVQLWAGSIDVDRHAVVVQLESLTVPGPEVLEALGAGPVRNACQPPQKGGAGGDLSGCDSPHIDDLQDDGSCDGDRRVCHVFATNSCDECRTACAAPCDSCRLRCWTQSSQNHENCVEGCLATARQCEGNCQKRLDDANKACISASLSCWETIRAKH